MDGEFRGEFLLRFPVFAGSKRDAESKPEAEQSRPAAASNKPAKQMGLAEQEGFYPIDETIEDDDLPF